MISGQNSHVSKSRTIGTHVDAFGACRMLACSRALAPMHSGYNPAEGLHIAGISTQGTDTRPHLRAAQLAWHDP